MHYYKTIFRMFSLVVIINDFKRFMFFNIGTHNDDITKETIPESDQGR